MALIIRNGKIIYHMAFGHNDLQKTRPLRTDNIFRIASQTKAITSMAVMMLFEEGKFLLDDPVSRYIPEFAKQIRTGIRDTTEKGSSPLPIPEGVFEWGGAFSTTYWADPKEKLIGVFYRQLWSGTFGEIANKFKVLV